MDKKAIGLLVKLIMDCHERNKSCMGCNDYDACITLRANVMEITNETEKQAEFLNYLITDCQYRNTIANCKVCYFRKPCGEIDTAVRKILDDTARTIIRHE